MHINKNIMYRLPGKKYVTQGLHYVRPTDLMVPCGVGNYRGLHDKDLV